MSKMGGTGAVRRLCVRAIIRAEVVVCTITVSLPVSLLNMRREKIANKWPATGKV